MKKKARLLLARRIVDGSKASTFGCCTNTRILAK
jgi:hypothetical protein